MAVVMTAPAPSAQHLRRLQVGGTPFGGWAALAQAAAQALSAKTQASGWLVQLHEQPPPAGTSAPPHDRWLLFVESPARALDAALTTAAARASAVESAPVSAIMAAWREGSRLWLNHAHALPGRCLLVDAEEARANPDGLAAVLAGWLGASLESLPLAETPPRDALLQLLTYTLATNDRRAIQLHAELQASCITLPGQPEAPANNGDDGDKALTRYLQLAGVESQNLKRAKQHGELLEDLRETRQALQRESDRHAETNRQIELLHADRVELQRSRQHSQLLLAQLHQLQEDMEALLERRQQEQASRATAEAASERERSQLLMTLRAELQRARQEGQLLQAQLHQTQEELEALLAREREARLELETLVANAGHGIAVRAKGSRLCAVRDQAPHRELQIDFDQVVIGTQTWPQLTLRLVEHEGRPGLVVFASLNEPNALAQWRPNGSEDGRELLLLVPQDASGSLQLAHMGASDWQIVQAMARLLQGAVAEHGASLAAHWTVVAARLQVQLQAMPPRLRYDGIEVAADPGTQGVQVRLSGVLHGDRALAPISLRVTAGGAGSLSWLLDGGTTEPPLAAWPTQGDGTLAETLSVPTGAGTSWRQRMRWWTTLDETDRDLLLGLLDTLPAALSHADAEALPPGQRAARMTETARRLRGVARRATVAGRVGLALRRMFRGGGS
jgi:hypothetical protein